MGRIIPVFREIQGMHTDSPVDDVPNGFVRRITDFLPNSLVSPVRRRGGWSYKTQSLGASFVKGLVWARHSRGDRLVMVTQDTSGGATKVYHATPPLGTGSGFFIANLQGGTANVIHPPVFHRDLVVFTAQNIFAVTPYAPRMYHWDGAQFTVDDLAFGAPNAGVVASWGDYLLLANDGTTPNRIWFSAVGDPQSFDIVNGYVDAPTPVTAIAPKGNTIFVFGNDAVHLLLGDTPPPGGNLTMRKFSFSQGCPDPRGISSYKDYVIWANPSGIYKSDGSQPIDLTQLAGVKTYWQKSYLPEQGDVLSLGVYRNYLFASITLGAGQAAKRCFVFDLDKNTCWEWSNIPASSFTPVGASIGSYSDDLLFGASNLPRVGAIASAFSPPGTDPNGAGAMTAVIETPALRFSGLGYKRIRRVFLTAQNDTGGDTGNIYYGVNPEATPGGQPSSLNFVGKFNAGASPPSVPIRIARFVNRKLSLVHFYLEFYSGDTRVYGLEAEVEPADPERHGDPHG